MTTTPNTGWPKFTLACPKSPISSSFSDPAASRPQQTPRTSVTVLTTPGRPRIPLLASVLRSHRRHPIPRCHCRNRAFIIGRHLAILLTLLLPIRNTAQLWKTVMTYIDDTKNSRGKRATPSATESVTSLPTSSSATTPRKAAAKVIDADFMESVLEPYGIMIQKGIAQDAYKEKFTLSVWLEPDIEAIQQEYAAMKMDSCNEAEYSTFALSNIFRNEPRLPVLPEESGDQRWLPIRTVQLVQKPTPDGWLSPPPIPGRKPPKRYDWDIRTDCTYHVSVQAFQPGFRALVEEHTSVVQQRAFCPYLTVEFKKDEQNFNTACYQVAVASAISLYNRYRLKSLMLEASRDRDSWSEEDKSQMRHYGIKFTGSRWKLWCTKPKTFPEWTGCVMSSIHAGNCCSHASTQLLVDLINDIHYWGLEVHGKSCKADITARVRSCPQADETDITILE
ncbi:hypothetical protein GGR55DRAFT_101642 [Xylaria sp. FL0064]|nr:hypothetical protein GGR55DRAFT_101642 [Xylaria sp. FL0064]